MRSSSKSSRRVRTAARAGITLLDEVLRPPDSRPSPVAIAPGALLVTLAEGNGNDAGAPPPATSPIDFDLLGEAPPAPEPPAARALRLRRKMLTAHQGLGLGLLTLQLATTTVGQLHYSDRFGGPSTGRYQLSHSVLAYSTVGVFALNGLVALLAPSPIKKPARLDRVMVHRVALLTAAAGMATQAALGIYAHRRMGYLDEERIATTHLVIGYATLAAIAVGVGVLVF